MSGDRDVGRPAQVAVGRAGNRRVSVPRGDQDRPSRRAQGLQHETRRLAGDMVLLKKIAATGNQIRLGRFGSLDDPLKRRPEVLPASLCADAIEALARERSIEMQVSEMEQAKGHKSPVTTRIVPAATASASAKAAPIIKVGLSLFRISRRRDYTA